MSSRYYVELVFYGSEKYNCAIIRKIDWIKWKLETKSRLILSDQRVTFLYTSEEIKYYWKAFRHQSDSFDIERLRISLKEKKI